MKIGYARVSTDDQNLALQLDVLRAEGCGRMFQDTASGTSSNRKGLVDALAACTDGDVLTVWKLDPLGRSLLDPVGLVEALKACGVGLKVLTGAGASIDTTKPEGRLFFAMAEFKRELLREQTRAGNERGEAAGGHVGRPRKLGPDQFVQGGAARSLRAVAATGCQGAGRGHLNAA